MSRMNRGQGDRSIHPVSRVWRPFQATYRWSRRPFQVADGQSMCKDARTCHAMLRPPTPADISRSASHSDPRHNLSLEIADFVRAQRPAPPRLLHTRAPPNRHKAALSRGSTPSKWTAAALKPPSRDSPASKVCVWTISRRICVCSSERPLPSCTACRS